MQWYCAVSMSAAALFEVWRICSSRKADCIFKASLHLRCRALATPPRSSAGANARAHVQASDFLGFEGLKHNKLLSVTRTAAS